MKTLQYPLGNLLYMDINDIDMIEKELYEHISYIYDGGIIENNPSTLVIHQGHVYIKRTVSLGSYLLSD